MGSPCRTSGGKTATRYHTARFILVPALREELDVLVPEDRGPGRPRKPGPPVEGTPAAPAAKLIRIGYARCSIAQQVLRSQLDGWHQSAEPAQVWRARGRRILQDGRAGRCGRSVRSTSAGLPTLGQRP